MTEDYCQQSMYIESIELSNDRTLQAKSRLFSHMERLGARAIGMLQGQKLYLRQLLGLVSVLWYL